MTQPGRIHIGTSGWAYPHWKGPFYPADLPDSRLLEWYCRHFHTVKINNAFYHLPGEQALDRWRATTPPGFLFATKASRYITHMKKLRDPDAALATFFGRMSRLGARLGPVLYQLPPRWRCNPERLAAFLDALPAGHRHAFEFRDTSWINAEILALLRTHRAAFCIYDLAGYLSPFHVTADFVYIRLHGPDGAYQGKYDGRTLAGWARRIRSWRDEGRDVYCYFDNDEAGYAVENARDLRNRLEGTD